MPLTLVTSLVSAFGVGVFGNHDHDLIHLGSVVVTAQSGWLYIALLDNGQGELVSIESPRIGNLSLSMAAGLDEPVPLHAEGPPVAFRDAVRQEQFAVKYNPLPPLMILEAEPDPDFIRFHSVVAQEELSCICV
jgi:hypothetical protein